MATTREAHPPGSSRDDRGAAAVEFALITPLLLLIVFGIINFGILFSQQLTLNNAVREGDRRAVVSGQATSNTCNGIIDSVKQSGLAMNSSLVGVQVTPNGYTSLEPCGTGPGFVTTFQGMAANVPCRGSAPGGSLIVEAQYDAAIPVAFPPFPKSVSLSSKAVFRCEFN